MLSRVLLSFHSLQRIRARALVHFERAFQDCDIIITPATPTTAPDMPAAVQSRGVYDVAQTFETIRFTQVRRRMGCWWHSAGHVGQEACHDFVHAMLGEF